MSEYAQKFQEGLECDAESVMCWYGSPWLTDMEQTVLDAILALAED